MRPGVVVIEFEIPSEALVHTNGHGVVVGTDSAEDVGHSAEAGVAPLGVTNRGVRGSSKLTAGTNAVRERQSACR